MSERGLRKTQFPCEGCGLHRLRCLCAEIPRLNLRTRLTLVVHHRELKRTTNTGRLATKALANSELLVRGRPESPLSLKETIQGQYHSYLLFPADEAIPLSMEHVQQAGARPIQLIVPDGNWRQASKVHLRYPELAHIERVCLTPALDPERSHLRAESSPYGMSTLQAIAYALGVIEGMAVQEELLTLYEKKLFRTLQGRQGKI